MIITIASTKGGVGKSTLALHLAYAYAVQGLRVCLLDGDAQGSVYKWTKAREQSGLGVWGFGVGYAQGEGLLSLAQTQALENDVVLIDSAGTDDATSRSALLCGDAILTPCGASALDLWELAPLGALVQNLEKAQNRIVPLYAVFSRVPSSGRTRLLGEARDFLSGAGWSPARVLEGTVGERSSYRRAAGAGQTVFDYRPSDKKAQAETVFLAEELLQKLKTVT